jgi:prepilin-type N-terminal cleavage/methylation domain-containing protein
MKIFSKPRSSRRKKAHASRQKSQSLLTSAATIKRLEHRAMTLLEILVVCAVLAILAVILLPTIMPVPHHYGYAGPQCVNNLKQTALACRVWEGDNNDKFPPFVSVTNGGSMEYVNTPNVWRHFQVMSNELSTPKVLVCPQDTARFVATNFTFMNNSNISFFFGVDASDSNPNMILSGDRNITNGTPVKNAMLNLTTNRPAGWTSEIHNKVGNLALADGSIQQVSISGLRMTVTNTGFATNRLQMPVLRP